MPQGGDMERFRNALLDDVASTIIRRIGGQHSVVRSYLRLDIGSTPNARRLLQNTQTMYATLTIDGNIQSPGMSADASSVADTVANAISQGTLESGASQQAGVSVPQQTPVIEGGRSTESSSSSSSLSSGAVAGIVIGVIVGVIVLAIAAFFLCRGHGSKSPPTGSTELEDEHSHVEHHTDEEMEMQTV